MQAYKTIKNAAMAQIEEKRSQFIANVGCADTEEKAIDFLKNVRAKHRTAAHNVYAYTLREQNLERYSDDGEPSKTAGAPVLEVVRHSGLTNIIVIVTRYFGGTLLGTGGLVRAYTKAAQAGIDAAEVAEIAVCVKIKFSVEYSLYDMAVNIIEQAGAGLSPPQYNEKVSIECTMLDGTQYPLVQSLNELTRGMVKIDVSEPFFQ